MTEEKVNWSLTTPILGTEVEKVDPGVFVDESTYYADIYEAVQKSNAPQSVKTRLRKLAVRAATALLGKAYMDTAESISDPKNKLEAMAILRAHTEGTTEEQAMAELLKTEKGAAAYNAYMRGRKDSNE